MSTLDLLVMIMMMTTTMIANIKHTFCVDALQRLALELVKAAFLESQQQSGNLHETTAAT